MLTAFLHRRRMAAKALENVQSGIGSTRKIYGTRLLIRGLLWVSVYLLSRGLLKLGVDQTALRVAIALLPVPFFVSYLWTWMNGVAAMDELQRRIELEALGFAFPATLVFLMTIGLLDLAITLPPEVFRLHELWLMMPMLYYIGLWRAQRRYA
jgi:hypothetical protein